MKKITLLALMLFGVWASSFGQASLCENATSITLPYSTTDTTANYGNNYAGGPGISCNGPLSYLYGNDVVYAYTATFDGSINLVLSTQDEVVGLFIYGSCANIGQVCLAGVTNQEVLFDTPISIEAFPVVEGTTYYFVISNAAPVEAISYSLNIAANTCINPTVTYTIVSDCTVTEQFFVAIDVENLGSANSLFIADDQGAEQYVTEPGTVTFGPYPNETLVQYNVYNYQDPNCTITSVPQTQLVCAPANNFCSSAVDLSLETSPINGTTINSTNQNLPSCSFNNQSGDVYYSITVPSGSTLTINQTESDYESVVSIFLGNCENPLHLTCIDYGDRSYIFMNGFEEEKTFYWVQDGFNGQTGNFTLEWFLTDCQMPEVGYTMVPQCQDGAEQFLVSAEIYSLGSASSITITDDMGNAPQIVTETGVIQFGPYENFTEVILTATNNDDANCFAHSQTMIQYYCPPCTQATVSYDFVLDCGPNPGYSVNVNVSDMGSSTAITIVDDQGSESQSITETGIYQFGPYLPSTPLVFTISDDMDENCVFVNEVQSYSFCPPVNDNCTDAIALVPGFDLESAAVLTTNLGGTPSSELPLPTCGNMYFSSFAKDVWYTVAVPASGSITIETTGSGEPGLAVLMDSVLQVYSGDCTGLTPLECDNDEGVDNFSILSLIGRTAGEVLYIRAFGFWGASGSFKIAAYDASLSNPAFDDAGFTSFPNPVKDILNLSYTSNITNVSVFNMLGQEALATSINASKSQIDMSNLSKGTYLVRIMTDNQVKTVKVVKE